MKSFAIIAWLAGVVAAGPAPLKTGPIVTTGNNQTSGAITMLAGQLVVSTPPCVLGQVAEWNGTAWACGTGGSTGTVTSITAGTGMSGGTITTSGTIALANTAVTAATYTYATVTFDAQGRATSASNGVTPALASTTISASTGLTGGGDLSTNRSFALANTAVSAGSYTYASVTVDAQGRLTAASSGTAPAAVIASDFAGTNGVIPKRTGTTTYGDSSMSDSGSALSTSDGSFAVTPATASVNLGDGSTSYLRYVATPSANFIESGTSSSSGHAATLSFTDINASNTWMTIGTTGAVSITSSLNVLGNTTLGDASTDTLTINATTTHAAPDTVQDFRSTVINGGTITGTTNDWAPTGLTTATTIYVTGASTPILNGITGAAEGRYLTICNQGAESPAISIGYEASAETTTTYRINGESVVDPTGSPQNPSIEAGYCLTFHSTVKSPSGALRWVTETDFDAQYVYTIIASNPEGFLTSETFSGSGTNGRSVRFNGSGTVLGTGAWTDDGTNATANGTLTSIVGNNKFGNLIGTVINTTASGTQNNWAPTGNANSTYIENTSGSLLTITGFVGGVDGRMITIYNNGAGDIDIPNNSSSSTSTDRFNNVDGTVVLTGNQGCSANFTYNVSDGFWHEVALACNHLPTTNFSASAVTFSGDANIAGHIQGNGLVTLQATATDPSVFNSTSTTIEAGTTTGTIGIGDTTTGTVTISKAGGLIKTQGLIVPAGTAMTGTDISSCGTGTPTMTTGSTDQSGQLTTGSGATTSCTVALKQSHAAAPFCVCNAYLSTTFVACTVVPTTSALVFTIPSGTSNVIKWMCLGPS